MKKSFLCILLVFVLLLGGCVLTDFPVKTEGMASCTQLMLELHSLMKSTEKFLMTIYETTPPADAAEIEQRRDDLASTVTRLKDSLLPSCEPYLTNTMHQRTQVADLLDQYTQIHQMTYESFECYVQGDTKQFIQLWLEAEDKSTAASDSVRTLITSWEETNQQVISSMMNNFLHQSKAQKISNCQQMAEMLLLLMEGELRLNWAHSQATEYVTVSKTAVLEDIEAYMQVYQSFRSEFQTMHDQADSDLKKLSTPLYEKIALPMDEILQQLQTAVEAMKTQNDPQTAEITLYRQNSTKTYALLRLSFIEQQSQCVKNFKEATE